MYMELVRHNVACCNDQYFCYICRTKMSNSKDAWNHINGNIHWRREFHEKFHVSLETMTNRKKTLMLKLSKRNGTIVTSYSYFCIICQENILDVMSILMHIQSPSHNENVKSRKNDDYVAVMSDMKTELKRRTEEIDIQPVLDANPNYKKAAQGLYKCIYVELFKRLHSHSDEIFKIFVSNGIIIFDSYDIKCPFCSCLIDFELALKHIKEHESQEALTVTPSNDDTLPLFKFEPERCTKLNENIVPDTNEEGINETKEIGIAETLSEEQIIATVSNSGKRGKSKFKCTFCGSEKCYYDCSEEFVRTLAANEIRITNRGNFKCKLCKCRRLKGVSNILDHIKSMSHKQLKNNKFKESLNKELVIDCPNVTMKVNMNQTSNLNGNSCDVNQDVVPTMINSGETVSIEVDTSGKKNNKPLNANKSNTAARNNTQGCKKKSKMNSSGAAVTKLTKGIDKTPINDENNSVGSLITKDINQMLNTNENATTAQNNTQACKKKFRKNSSGAAVTKVTKGIDKTPINDENNSVGSLITKDINQMLNTNENATTAQNNTRACKKKFRKNSSGAAVTKVTKGIDKISINDENNSIGSLITKDINQQMLNTNESATAAWKNTQACKKKSKKNSYGADISKITEEINKISMNDENNSIGSLITKDINQQMLNANESATAAQKNVRACENKSEKNSSGANITEITEEIDKISVNNENKSIESLITKDIKQHITKFLNIPPKRQTPEEENVRTTTLTEDLNRPYPLKYLEIEEAMYNIQGQLNSIQKSLRFIVPYSVLSKNFYCLLCNDPVSKEIATLYEHVCLEKHEMQVNKIMEDSESEKLSQQYMKENENVVRCFTCNMHQVVDTDKHIKTNNHQMNHKKFVKATNELFTYVSQALCDMWYSIQQFGCALCKTSFKYKLDFLQHIIEMHKNVSLKDMVFDFCIPCTTLWLSIKNSYAEHCKGKIHKYLVKKQDFMVGDLPESIENILQHVDDISDTLLQYTQVSLNDNVQDEILESLENSLRAIFPNVKAYVFGSRVAGLATANSDVDIYVDCGNMYNQDIVDCLRKDHLTQIKQVLSEDREEWWIKEILTRTRIPLIKLVHKQTGLNCDISSVNGLSVEKTKLLRALNDSYLPCRKLILFVKKWFYYFDLPPRYGIISYGLTWLVMFYLQTESYLPSVASLLKEGKQQAKGSNKKPTVISGWDVDVAQPKDNNNDNSKRSTSTLLMGFFQFYAEFDYRRNVVCPLMGHPVLKTAFSEVDLPDEMGSYIWQLRMSKTPKYFRIDSPLCVQDPFELSENMTKGVSAITLNYFRQYCRKSAVMLESLSK
ncbi:uncharacterized protein LOC108632082 [Ceratina calcarata]|uniref:Uncharacterized protein LOC108632082 n=1 Tax=Ceratina calcarata TaxID=156304 RepID=A0AAJ7SDQ8_9HYME|nr:uncharacterized protein LOC108632082 [Ceratina calcarata]XP_026675262.1 uncharacterized protein LOC108632082 [Ceratina calcarata]XP_026675263.1 uncharacterized protein LOC108632082 [Ceratina calcarata]XP_026675264.1 uncharacterized protein LOC108632082 [Ceratina calcarata]